MIKNSILLGAPGSGKGTIASLIASNYDVVHVSTGDIFRLEIKNKTSLGLKVASILASGKYVNDGLTNEIVKGKITSLLNENKIFFLDGYPRTLNQVEFLTKLIPLTKNFAILLDVDSETIIKRISGRRSCPNCQKIYHLISNPSQQGKYCQNHLKEKTKLILRPDDEEKTIKKRLAIYFEQTAPLIDFYRAKNALIQIDGSLSPQQVCFEILTEVFGLEVLSTKAKLGL